MIAAHPIRVLVCGGRNFPDCDFVWNELMRLDSEIGPFAVIIHGCSGNIDSAAEIVASALNKRHDGAAPTMCLGFRAEWDRYGKRAGPIRNQRMLDEGRPDVVIAFPGGRGTADMIRRAIKAGIRVVKVHP